MHLKKIVLFFLYFSVSIFGCLEIARAFPEMTRLGYNKCVYCHVSPTGGGLLTNAGRESSSKFLSSWSVEKEELLFNGVEQDEAFNVGGDFRGLNWKFRDPIQTQEKSVFMQADLELGLKLDQLQVVTSFGAIQKSENIYAPGSRRYYLMYTANDFFRIRAGRFMPAFGLNVADHYLSVKDSIGLGQGREFNATELSWIFCGHSTFLGYQETPKEADEKIQERGLSLQHNESLNETTSMGLSLWASKGLTFERSMISLSASVGMNTRHYLLGEIVHQTRKDLSNGRTVRGVYEFLRYGYEMTQGLHFILQEDQVLNNTESSSSRKFTLGAGLDWFPRPHIEIQGMWNKVADFSVGSQLLDFSFIMIHYYL